MCAHMHAEYDSSQLCHTVENVNIMFIKMLKLKDAMIMFCQIWNLELLLNAIHSRHNPAQADVSKRKKILMQSID